MARGSKGSLGVLGGHGNAFQGLPNVWRLSYAKICFFELILHLLARGPHSWAM